MPRGVEGWKRRVGVMRGDEGLAGMQVEVQGLSRQGQVQKDVQTIEPAAVAEEAVVEALCVAEGRILTLKFDGRLGPWAGAARACGCWEFLGGQVCGTSRAQVQEGVQKTIVFGAEDKEEPRNLSCKTGAGPMEEIWVGLRALAVMRLAKQCVIEGESLQNYGGCPR
ncbi:unnamed protein product [Symbiodinium natans]|uniref:Uncharacterized protein n=1 Tax=Symbiodinium natans TaxID=878477 RepID=A0A812RUK6_9DINO|nr:unnamed protein product [Symbiodinium natans]